MSKPPRLIPVDLLAGNGQTPPGINARSRYLARIDDKWYAGGFSKQWYGYSFNGWGGGAGLQFDRPGSNCSRWQELYEIRA